MARKIVVQAADGSSPVLEETAARDEEQLQELLKDNPDLLPVEEFGMTSPVLVVGRETSLPSGAVDLVVLARSGELLIIEFKTGPQNTDFRHSLAQLLDYGSDLWSMSYEDLPVIDVAIGPSEAPSRFRRRHQLHGRIFPTRRCSPYANALRSS